MSILESMKKERDVLKDACERLFHHHRESAELCNELEEVGKACEQHHKNKHAFNREIYKKLRNSDSRDRVLHFPKIIKDAFMMKRKARLTERRKHTLKVYKTLKDSGAYFEMDVNRW